MDTEGRLYRNHFIEGTWAPAALFSGGWPGPSPPQILLMTVQWCCDHSSSDFLPAYCFLALVLSCLLHSHSSHVPWPEALHGSPGPIEKHCPLKPVTMLFQEVPNGQSKEDTVGRPLPHLAAAMQASGEAVYCDDIPRYENELFLRLVTSTRAHAKIKCVQWKHLGRREHPPGTGGATTMSLLQGLLVQRGAQWLVFNPDRRGAGYKRGSVVPGRVGWW